MITQNGQTHDTFSCLVVTNLRESAPVKNLQVANSTTDRIPPMKTKPLIRPGDSPAMAYVDSAQVDVDEHVTTICVEPVGDFKLPKPFGN